MKSWGKRSAFLFFQTAEKSKQPVMAIPNGFPLKTCGNDVLALAFMADHS